MLAKMKRLAPPDSDGRAATLRIQSSGRSYLRILKVRDLAKSFTGRRIFSNISFEILRGDRVGLIGPNGSGKSTLVRIITGELEPDAGEVRVGGNVTPAYFDQELSILDSEDTVLDSVWEEKPQAEAGELRSYLGRYLFSGDEVFKSVSALSGGEKSRLALAKILLLPANFLILDEPTNHLDIPSCERLEEALSEYDGATLIISHDRFFLDKTVTKILSLENGSLRVFSGNYSEFAAAMAAEKQAAEFALLDERKELEKKARLNEWEERKEKRRVRKQIERLETEIYRTETELKETEIMLQDEDVQSDWERLTALQESRTRLQKKLDDLLWKYDEFDVE
jgi:ATP-binding cassette subfamily F protein 3